MHFGIKQLSASVFFIQFIHVTEIHFHIHHLCMWSSLKPEFKKINYKVQNNAKLRLNL